MSKKASDYFFTGVYISLSHYQDDLNCCRSEDTYLNMSQSIMLKNDNIENSTVRQPFVWANIKRNIQARVTGPLWGESPHKRPVT